MISMKPRDGFHVTSSLLAVNKFLTFLVASYLQVSSKGTLTGGYYKNNRSKLEIQKQRKSLQGQIKETEEELTKLKNELKDLETQITAVVSESQKIETKNAKAK